MKQRSKKEWIAIVAALIVVVYFMILPSYSFPLLDKFSLEEGYEEVRVGELVIQDLTLGSGDVARSGDTVTVHYIGTLENGVQFDSSRIRNEPLTFVVGAGVVIKGWDVGILGMREGGKRLLTIPPSLGYKDVRTGSIPPNSTLIFEIELLEIAPRE